VFQLVLQFAPWGDRDFDDLVRLEDRLEALVDAGEVDGHDLGSNEANIFIFTENPAATLSACLSVIAETDLLATFSAGYRSVDDEAYVRVWPAEDSSLFSVK
jgi:hypothetical protein